LDGNYFTTSAAEYWWSSQRQANDTNKVWVTNAGGGVGNHPRTETVSAGGTKKFHVRAVRDASTPPIVSRFTSNTNGTVSDMTTGLAWQQVPNADTLTWEQALSYADTLSLGGFNDWRVPNIKELQSINDETIINPSINTAFFTVSGPHHYWSSTSLPNQTTIAWYLDTQFGLTTYAVKTSKLYLLCVRGGYTTTAINLTKRSNYLYIYPNPVSNILSIKYAGTIKKISIVNTMGVEVLKVNGGADAIDMSGLLAGNYVLILQDESGSSIKKIIAKEN
jgi:hypothetical protein